MGPPPSVEKATGSKVNNSTAAVKYNRYTENDEDCCNLEMSHIIDASYKIGCPHVIVNFDQLVTSQVHAW